MKSKHSKNKSFDIVVFSVIEKPRLVFKEFTFSNCDRIIANFLFHNNCFNV